MRALLQNLRYAVRQIVQSPGFTITVVLCLGIGIAANLAVFEGACVLLYPDLGISEPERVVRIYSHWAEGGGYSSVSVPDYEDVRDNVEAFERVAVVAFMPTHYADGPEAERTWGEIVSWNYFRTLGADMTLGRDFTAEEAAEPGAHPVLILSHGFWQRRYAGDPGVIGRQVTLNGFPYTVIGVSAEGYRANMVGAYADLYVPLFMRGQLQGDWTSGRGNHWLNNMVARLKPGVTVAQAEAEVQALFTRLREEYPDTNVGLSADVLSERASALHPTMRSNFAAVLIVLEVFTGILLLLTCANTAGLALARASARRRELAIRLSLGAARRQLIGQLLFESLVLAVLAGIAGYLMSGVMDVITAAAQPDLDIPLQWGGTSTVSGFWAPPLLTLIAALFFGLIPARDATRVDVLTSLTLGRATTGKRTHRLRNLLVTGQVAASLFLLIGAGLALRSLEKVQNIDPGFDPSHQLLAGIDLDSHGSDEATGKEFHRRLKERLEALPGIETVGRGLIVPLSFRGNSTWVYPEGYEAPTEEPPSVSHNIIDEDYFDAMGIRLLRGRSFTADDDGDAPRVMVINQVFADRFFGEEDPLGKMVRISDPESDPYRVIGVVETGRYYLISEDPAPFFYRNWNFRYSGEMTYHLRTTGDPFRLAGAVREVVRELDPTLPVGGLNAMENTMDLAFLPARLIAGSVSVFAALALLLACLGLYGLIAFTVARSTREIGIRIALGAQRGDVIAVVVRTGLVLVLIGALVGLGLGAAGSFAISRALYGVSPLEPVALAPAVLLLAATAVAAAWFPARRATRVNPVDALRVE